MKKLGLMTVTVVMSLGILAGCGKKSDKDTAESVPAPSSIVTEASVTEVSLAETEDSVYEEINLDEEVEKVQATLTYMGGLYVNHDPENDMELAIFRNEDGDIIYIIYELGHYDYGMYTTEDKTLEDGTTYEEIQATDATYGYYFDEDLTTGILVGADGVVREAIELDESVARDLVTYTIKGE